MAKNNATDISNGNSDFNRKFNHSPDIVFEWSIEKILEISDSTKILNGSDVLNLILNWDVGDHWYVQDLGRILRIDYPTKALDEISRPLSSIVNSTIHHIL